MLDLEHKMLATEDELLKLEQEEIQELDSPNSAAPGGPVDLAADGRRRAEIMRKLDEIGGDLEHMYGAMWVSLEKSTDVIADCMKDVFASDDRHLEMHKAFRGAIQAELDGKLTPLYDKHMGTMSRLRALVDMKLANKGEKVKVDTPRQYKKLILKIEDAEDKVNERLEVFQQQWEVLQKELEMNCASSVV